MSLRTWHFKPEIHAQVCPYLGLQEVLWSLSHTEWDVGLILQRGCAAGGWAEGSGWGLLSFQQPLALLGSSPACSPPQLPPGFGAAFSWLWLQRGAIVKPPHAPTEFPAVPVPPSSWCCLKAPLAPVSGPKFEVPVSLPAGDTVSARRALTLCAPIASAAQQRHWGHWGHPGRDWGSGGPWLLPARVCALSLPPAWFSFQQA